MTNFTITNLIIEIITILSIISALAVITSTNPVIAIIFLIGLFLNVAIYLILMGLNFIGLSYLLVYIGGITVFILFIIMMIAPDMTHTVEVGTDYSKLLPLVFSVSVLFLILFLMLIPSFTVDLSSFELYNTINDFVFSVYNKIINIFNHEQDNYSFNLDVLNYLDSTFKIVFKDVLIYTETQPATVLHKNLQIQSIGQALYGNYAILLLASSVLLLLALVAPIILTKQK